MIKCEKDTTDSVSIIIPTYNASLFIIKCIDTIKSKTEDVDYKVVVVDNASDLSTKKILYNFLELSKIDILCCLEKNRYWAEANNIGASISPKTCNKFLLLNSDVKILDPLWLKKLLNIHKVGLTSFGVVSKNTRLGLPERGDGYCALIDRNVYEKYYLDENFPWWFGITKLQSQILNDKMSVQAIKDHSNIIAHYGGASSDDVKLPSNFFSIDPNVTKEWFINCFDKINIINQI